METLMIKSNAPDQAWDLLEDEVAGLYGDNGGDPDGNAWLPSDIVTRDEALPVLEAALGVMVEVKFATDEAMAHYLYGPTVVVDLDDEDQVQGMKDEADVKTRGWAHYNAYGAADSRWVFIP